MKRIVLAAGATLALVLSLVVGAAAAAGPKLTLTAHPNPAAGYHSVTWSGVLTQNGAGIFDASVSLQWYQDNACTVANSESAGPWSVTTDASGAYSKTLVANVEPMLSYWMSKAYVGETLVKSPCLPVRIMPADWVQSVSAWEHPDNAFVCYSKFQTDPAVFPAAQIPDLLKQGYWTPWAVKGNVTGGTNVGAYHLACNLTAGQAETGTYVDHDGVVYGTNLGGVPGVYPLAG